MSASPEPARRGRAQLLLVGAAFVLPLAFAALAYWLGWAPGATANYGELLAPARPLAGPPFDALRGRWVLVSFDAAACDAYCERKLYFMRQLRRAQGKDQERVERLWVLTDAGEPRAPLLAAVEGTRLARDPSLAARFPASASHADHIYVIDPLGNLMMRYPRDPDPSRMLKDLQRLLRLSQVG